jgi:hypothetical protein
LISDQGEAALLFGVDANGEIKLIGSKEIEGSFSTEELKLTYLEAQHTCEAEDSELGTIL